MPLEPSAMRDAETAGLAGDAAPAVMYNRRVPRLVLLSDTHGMHDTLRVPEGDVLVHTGDFCTIGDEQEARSFAEWFLSQPHAHKVVIAGNHDLCLERDLAFGARLFEGATYLLDGEATIAGLRFYGSPWQPEFMGWGFNLPRGEPLRRVWSKIPNGIDVLLTHGPPFGVLDRTLTGMWVGCEELRVAVDRAQPRLHVFGHIHEGLGVHTESGVVFVNAAICDYRSTQDIVVADVPLDRARPVTWTTVRSE